MSGSPRADPYPNFEANSSELGVHELQDAKFLSVSLSFNCKGTKSIHPYLLPFDNPGHWSRSGSSPDRHFPLVAWWNPNDQRNPVPNPGALLGRKRSRAAGSGTPPGTPHCGRDGGWAISKAIGLLYFLVLLEATFWLVFRHEQLSWIPSPGSKLGILGQVADLGTGSMDQSHNFLWEWVMILMIARTIPFPQDSTPKIFLVPY